MGEGEIYLEFQEIGGAVRVAAVDAATGVEVVLVAPTGASRQDIARVAAAKLQRALEHASAKGDCAARASKDPAPDRDPLAAGLPTRRGVLV
jgi:hypothetical protein